MSRDGFWSPQQLLEPLIRFPSVSSTSNAQITHWLDEACRELGFATELLTYEDADGVEKWNLVARRGPDTRGGLAFLAHSDVVPADNWEGPDDDGLPADPFAPVVQQGRLYGRGSCDMKGSLACMLSAIQQVAPEAQAAPLTLVCTADEEVGFVGAKQVAEASRFFSQAIHEQPLGIIGEPTELEVVHAHKGIAVYRFTARGVAAHSGTGGGRNANVAMLPVLNLLYELAQRTQTDPGLQNDAFTPPTLSWNFGISNPPQAMNIVPALSQAWVFFRPMPEIDGALLVEELQRCAAQHGVQMERLHRSPPVWMDPAAEDIRRTCQRTGQSAPKTVCFGTDGGQFTALNRLLVLGPGSIEQAHTTREYIALEQLARGTELFRRLIEDHCLPNPGIH